MKMIRPIPLALFSWLLTFPGISFLHAAQAPSGPIVVRACKFATTPPLKDIVGLAPIPASPAINPATPPREVPLGRLPRFKQVSTMAPSASDPAVQHIKPAAPMPAPLVTFEGVNNIDGVYPSDCNGDVGLNQYVEMVNMHMSVYDKLTGATLLAPFKMSTLFAAAGFPAPASTTDNGDPVVLYDHLANRWMISQFIVNVTPCHEVIGISQTSDATGAWYLYDFVMPNTDMNDYPKFGVWPDAYYMTDNQFTGGVSWHGAGAFAFERAKMLVGDPTATYQYFDLSGANLNFGGLLPADLDGPAPAAGTPEYFAMMDDGGITPGVYAVYLWKFHVDWTTPANSTFGANRQPTITNVVASFNTTFGSNVSQPGTAQTLDTLSDRLMFRLQYRTFGSYESLVTCHNVNVGTGGASQAGVRYYQFRRTLPSGTFSVAEQATYAPDGASRWMGSAAMDGQGNLAVGYSMSSTNIYPSIYYAGRMAGDPTNGLFQGESLLYAGTGSQTGSAGRWGDYTALVVDPVDDSTFYYVNEYLPTTSSVGWHTRIGSFRLSSPHMGTLTGNVTNTLSGAAIANATVTSTNGVGTLTDGSGYYTRSYPTGTWQIVSFAADFSTSSVATVVIQEGVTNVLNFGLSPTPMRISPAGGLTSSGQEGGPFSPASQSYIVTNASLSSFTWTGTVNQSWVSLSPAGGVLPAGGWTGVTASLVAGAVTVFPTGTYQASIIFSNKVSGETAARPVNLTVSPYRPPVIASYDFSSGLPPGWTVITNGNPACVWVFNDPGNRGNLTGGTGVFAIVDNDLAGSSATNVNTEMRSSSFNLTGYAQCFVGFRSDFYNFNNEIADVDISRNGNAGPWSNVWHQAGVSLRGPSSILVDITAAAGGSSNAMVRFHYNDNGSYGWWWEVDDVTIYAGGGSSGHLGITPQSGLAASGYYGGPFTPNRFYQLTNSAAGPLAWTSTWSSAWTAVQPAGGVLTAGAVTSVLVSITASADTLPPGLYQDHVTFTNTTEGLAQQRDVSLTIADSWIVTPATGLVSSGLEGGPFTPSNIIYTLANSNITASLPWSVAHTQSWITVSPASGLIVAGSSQTVTATLNAASLTTPGTYGDSLVFSNSSSGSTYTRAVSVSVVEITGTIAVYDSASPTNDLQIPFGAVGIGATRTESITVRNTGPSRNLTVSNIVFGLVFADFNNGLALNWRPDNTDHWSIVSGQYQAQPAAGDFMTSLYTGREWAASTIQADFSRSGGEGNSQGVVLRASADFNVTGTGTGYALLVSGESYSVWWVSNSSCMSIQGWTFSPAISPEGDNVINASASGTQLWLRVNGSLIWQGLAPYAASGFDGVCDYASPAATSTDSFDNVFMGEPQFPGTQPEPDQLYLNSNPQLDSSIFGPHDYGESHGKGSGVTPEGEGEGMNASPLLLPSGVGFSITNLPSLPMTLSPGASFTFNVTYAPSQIGTNTTSLSIDSNDNNTPVVSVSMSGHAAAGLITGGVVSATSGLPLANAAVTASVGTTNIANGLSDALGTYTLPAPTGTYTVVATLASYRASTNAGITVAADGAVAVCNFSLIASALTCSPTTNVLTSGAPGGPFFPTMFVYTLTNSSLSTVPWTISSGVSWLTVSPSGGSLAGGSSTTVTGSLNAAAATLPPGSYDGVLTFTNLSDAVWQQRHVMLSIARDYFTEIFTNANNDLDNMSLTFTPNGSTNYYAATKSANVSNFPTDPTGGSALALADDNFVQITLSSNATVSLYGVVANTLFAGSNGYLTFGSGDTTYSESLSAHFSLPRLSALFDDLDLSAGGTASYKQLADRLAITFQNAPQFGMANTNNFQFELFFNGVIRITWLGIADTGGLAGLSRGTGVPADFIMSDLSTYPIYTPPPILQTSPSSFNFGIVGTGITAQVTFIATNSGGSSLTGTAAVGGPFAVISNTTFIVPLLATTNVTVGFTPPAAGVFSNLVIFTSNGGNSTNAVTGTGATNPVWITSAITGNWSVATNWTPAIVPGNGAVVTFGGGGSTAVVDGVSRTVTTVLFNRGTGFVIGSSGGAGLTVTNGISVTDSNLYVINAPLALGSSNNWSVGTGGTLQINGVVSGSNTLTKTGGGTLILGGSNTYSGTTTVNAGTLRLSTNQLCTSAINVNAGTLELNVDNSASNTISRASTINVAGGASISLLLRRPFGLYANGNAGGLTINLNGGTFNLNTLPLGAMGGVAANLTGGSIVGGTGSRWDLGASGGFTGGISTLPSTNPSIISSQKIYLRPEGGVTNIPFVVAAGTPLTGIDLDIPSQISWTGGLIKDGAGVMRLGGTNDYWGQTVISNGTLLVTGSISNNTVTVCPAATLGGSGMVGGPVNVTAGGILSPGSQTGTGTLSISNRLTLADTSLLQFALGTNSDRVAVYGNLNLGGTVNLTDAGGFTSNTYTLITYTGTLTGTGLKAGTSPNPAYGFILDTNTTGLVKAAVMPAFNIWQIQYFGSVTNPLAGPTADPDNDGMNNMQEFLAGTIPTDPTSVLRIMFLSLTNSAMKVDFSSVSGKTYQLEWNGDLTQTNGWAVLTNNLTSPSNQLQFLTATPGIGVTNQFYRVKLQP